MVITSFYAISFSKEIFFGHFVIFNFLRRHFMVFEQWNTQSCLPSH